MKIVVNLNKERCCFPETITIEDKKLITSKNNIKKWIYLCLQSVFSKTRFAEIKHIMINVNFVNKNTMIEYNNNFRGINKITNVLSFANNVIIKNGCDTDIDIALISLGEMVLCCDKILEEAQEYNKTFIERYTHIFIHSILHLLGYDHIDEKERIKMEQLEETILYQLGIHNPYSIL